MAIEDLKVGALDHRRWVQFAVLNLKRGYWRTRLGFLWAPLSFLAFIVMLSVLWASILNRDISVYMPHFGYGVTCWIFISAIVSGGEQVFSANSGVIREFPLPLTFYAFTKMAKELIIFATSMMTMILLDVVYMRTMSVNTLLVLPAIAVYAANGVFVSLIMGMVTTRYRDIAQLIPTVMRAMFFFTPVLWTVDNVASRGAFADLNPFYHYIEIVRMPMQGKLASLLNWAVVGGCTLTAFMLVLAFYKIGTRQIRVWL